MDYLRQGIHLRGYAQKNPKQEYKREAFELFGALLERIKHDTVSLLSRLQVRTEAEIEEQERERERQMRAAAAAARRAAVGDLERCRRRRPARAGASVPRGATVRGRHAGPRPEAVAPGGARGPQGRPQRALPLRLGQEVQALPRPARARGAAERGHSPSTPTTIRLPGSDVPIAFLEVVAGAIFDADGRVLIAQRPAGKALAGRWEFPGGKLHDGEDARDGLAARTARGTGRRGAGRRAAHPLFTCLSRAGRTARPVAGHVVERRAARARRPGAQVGAAGATSPSRTSSRPTGR